MALVSHIPYGKIMVIQGEPGDGKTTKVLAIAAAVTKGVPLSGQKKTQTAIIFRLLDKVKIFFEVCSVYYQQNHRVALRHYYPIPIHFRHL